MTDVYTELLQENSELKTKVFRLEQERDELKQENERLQSEIRQKKMTIMMNNDHYLTVDENNRKYSSALEEIREIVKKYDAEIGDTIIANPIQDCYDIYLKINEVLQ